MIFKITCEEANHTCDKTQYNEASFLGKVKLNIHLLYCAACRKYTSRNRKLTKAIKSPTVAKVSTQEREALKARLQEQMKALKD